jgi:uncharacterized protein (DUF1810 family)
MPDSFNLQRFLESQAPVMDLVLEELRTGRKRTHWMWFIFPQVQGLGSSPTAVHFALSGAEEARAYLAHPVLGDRLRTCCDAILALPGSSPEAVFGAVDAMKLRSSMTLFAAVSGEAIFKDVLLKYYEGNEDPATREILD